MSWVYRKRRREGSSPASSFIAFEVGYWVDGVRGSEFESVTEFAGYEAERDARDLVHYLNGGDSPCVRSEDGTRRKYP